MVRNPLATVSIWRYSLHMATRKTWASRVALRVRRAIKDSDYTEEQVGIRAGIPNSTLSRCLNGHYPLNLLQLERIADVLQVPPSELLPPVPERQAS